MSIIQKLFQKTEEDGTIPEPFHEVRALWYQNQTRALQETKPKNQHLS